MASPVVAATPVLAPALVVAATAVAVPSHLPEEPPTSWREYSTTTFLARVLAGFSFATMVKALCMAGNVLVQVSPFPQVKRWERRGCTGEADAAPYVSIAFGGWQWCYYGLFAWLLTKRSGFLILVHSNFLGALLGSYYTVTFFRNCRDEASRQSLHLYLSAVSALVLLQACAVAVLPVERALFLTGLVSSFCSFVGAMSMLVTLPTVIRTQDSRPIPGPLVFANLLCSLVWCVCGWMLDDPLIAAPNVAAFLSSGACVYLKLRYPSDDMPMPGREMGIINFGQGDAGQHKVPSEFTPLSFPAKDSLDASPSTSTAASSRLPFSDDTGGTF